MIRGCLFKTSNSATVLTSSVSIVHWLAVRCQDRPLINLEPPSGKSLEKPTSATCNEPIIMFLLNLFSLCRWSSTRSGNWKVARHRVIRNGMCRRLVPRRLCSRCFCAALDLGKCGRLGIFDSGSLNDTCLMFNSQFRDNKIQISGKSFHPKFLCQESAPVCNLKTKYRRSEP